MSLEVLPRMDYWSDQAHALLELLARGERGRAWLHEALPKRRRAPRAFSRRGPRGRAGGRSPSRILSARLPAARSTGKCEVTRVAPDPTGLTLAEQIQAHADAGLLVAPHVLTCAEIMTSTPSTRRRLDGGWPSTRLTG